MSFIQDIQGIKVKASNALREGDFFARDPLTWPKGYAFGGWIYDVNVTLGFSKQPSVVTLSIVLETDKAVNPAPIFDISDQLLQESLLSGFEEVKGNFGAIRSAKNFKDEKELGHFYGVELHGVKFNRMYLYDYSIQIEANAKTLSVTLKDYSLILDKTYVGLMKRQGPDRKIGETELDICDPKHPSKKLLRNSTATAHLDAFCPNCYLEGEEFNSPRRVKEDPTLATMGGYGSNLDNFFTKMRGSVDRRCYLSSVIGRADYAKGDQSEMYYDNFVPEAETPEYKKDKDCFDATKAAYTNIGGAWGGVGGSYNPNWTQAPAFGGHLGNVPLATMCDQYSVGFDPRFAGGILSNAAAQGTNWVWTRRFSPKKYWQGLDSELAQLPSKQDEIGLTIDGGYLLLGTEEFAEKKCGELPNISYNFTELLNSLRKRGVSIFNTDGTNGSFMGENEDGIKIRNPAWPDKNPRFRNNYIGTLREVLEQWCGVYSLDFFYKDQGSDKEAGFYFIDLQVGAEIEDSGITKIVDPTTIEGKEFSGDDEEAESVIISYKESSTLENTYMQRVITSNVKPYMSKERKKSIKRYVPMLPLHPLDFQSPDWNGVPYITQLGEQFTYHQLANFIPYDNEPQTHFLNAAHRKRIWTRTNRELWDIDVSMALARLGQQYRDLYVGNRICENALSETNPIMEYGPEMPDRQGQPKMFHQKGDGQPGNPATEADLADAERFGTMGQFCHKRHGLDYGAPGGPAMSNLAAEYDLKSNLAALGFEQIQEIEDFRSKEDIIDLFMSRQEVEDISLDASNYKMFIGYYDKQLHSQYVNWEKTCADSMYGFGALVGGTLPRGPEFIPRDYYGTRDGQQGFEDCSEGKSIPKLSNSFEPAAAQYPIYNVEQSRRFKMNPNASFEARNAPFNSILIESGNFLPTGLYISQLDNPWGTTVEEFEKTWWRKFQDNACSEFNDSLNMIQEAGFNFETSIDANGNIQKTRAQTENYPHKTQAWDLNMFAPKFFQDTAKIFDALDSTIEELYQQNRLVDEISMGRWSVDYGPQRFCKKVSILVVSDTRGKQIGKNAGGGVYETRHPNILFNAEYQDGGAINYEARKQRELWEIAEYKRFQREGFRSRCDYDILYEFCEDAIQKDYYDVYKEPEGNWGFGQLDRGACAVDPTGVWKEGWNKNLVGGYPYEENGVVTPNSPKHMGRKNSRALRLTVVRNPNSPGHVPTSDLGWYHIQDLEEDLETLPQREFDELIVYPVNNFEVQQEGWNAFGFPIGATWSQDMWQNRAGGWNNNTWSTPPFQLYSGIWTADVTIEDRRPELIEIYGAPPATRNPTAGVRVINNTLDPDLGDFIDPNGRGFITRMYDHDGNTVDTIAEYHNYIAHGDVDGQGQNGLNHYGVMTPNKKVDITLAGSLLHFPNFKKKCDPKYGLQNLTISFSDQGVRTQLSFADRPPQAPQMEAILNKIGPRTMG